MQHLEVDVTPPSSPTARSPAALPQPVQLLPAEVAQRVNTLRDDYCAANATQQEKRHILQEMSTHLEEGIQDAIVGKWSAAQLSTFSSALVQTATALPQPSTRATSLHRHLRSSALFRLGQLVSFISGDAADTLLRSLLHFEVHEHTAEWEKGDGIDTEHAHNVDNRPPIDSIINEYNNNDVHIKMLPVIAPILTSEDWTVRVAGLRGVSAAISAGGQRSGEKAAVVIPLVVPLLCDPHPRVRNGACAVLMQKAEDWSDDSRMLVDCVDKIIPALVRALNDHVDRVAAHAAAALHVFFSPDRLAAKGSSHIAFSVLAHSSHTMAELERVMQNKVQHLMKEKRLACLAKLVSLTETVGKAQPSLLGEYYGRALGPLKCVLRLFPAASSDEATKMLARSTFACVARFGDHVLPSTYKRDAAELAQFLASSTDTGLFPSLLHGQGFSNNVNRLATVLGKQFLPHLVRIFPALIAAVSPTAKCTRSGYQMAEEVQLLLRLAEEFIDYIGPYIESLSTVARAARQHPRTYINEERWGYTIAPRLIESLVLKGDSTGAHDLWQELYHALKEVIIADTDKRCVGAVLEDIAAGLAHIGPTGVSAGMIEEMGGLVRGIMDDYEKNRSTSGNVHEAIQGVLLLSGVAQLLRAASKIGFDSLLTSDCHKKVGQWLLCFTRHDKPLVCWNAAFALGTLALAKSPAYDKEFIGTAVECLLSLVQAAIESTETDDRREITGAAENALSSSLKIAQSYIVQKEQIDRVHHILVDFLARCGVKEDPAEYGRIYGYFAALVERGDVILLGDKCKVLAIVVKALHNDVFSELRKEACELKSRLLALVKIIAIDGQVVAKAALTADEKETMRRIMNDL